jgi:hypothetical protein
MSFFLITYDIINDKFSMKSDLSDEEVYSVIQEYLKQFPKILAEHPNEPNPKMIYSIHYNTENKKLTHNCTNKIFAIKLLSIFLTTHLPQPEHCLICGTRHQSSISCPPEAFCVLTCSCGNEDLIPCDALFMGTEGMYCGQCNKDTDWKIKRATIEDMKKHWSDYGK